MKSKLIFFILLSSFIFNMVHDIVITINSKDKCPINIQLIEETMPNPQCNDISSLHHFFHFFAILNRFNMKFFIKVKSSLIISYSIWTFSIHNSIFRPPII